MTTLTSATGTISSAGIGSGLDVNSIVTQLMAVEKQPLTKLQTAAATMQTQLTAFGQLQSGVSALRDAAAPLFAATSFGVTNASSSDPTGVGATTAAGAVPGTYSIAVSSLSKTQTLVSASGQFAAATDTVGTGSLTIRLGAWNADQSSFTPKTGSADIVIPIGASESTLTGIRDKINAANAGVTATLVTDATGTRLALQSSTTGTENGFRVTVADDDANATDANGLSRLAYDPVAGAGRMTLAQAADNTQATINGIAVTSTSNSLAGVVDGLTFNLSKVTTTPITVNVSRNTDSVKTLLSNFVTAYNQLNKFLAEATKYDPATKQAALLQGDGTAVAIQNQLHTMLSQKTGASTFQTWSSIGVELQKDGSLRLNDTKVAAALQNLPELQKALATLDPDVPANNGLGKQFGAWADGLLSAAGALPGKAKSIQARIASNQKDQDAMTDRLELIEQRLRNQYTTLDSTMAKANALSKYVSQQIALWNKSSNSNDN